MAELTLRQSIFVVLILVQMIFALWPILIKTALDDGDKAIVIALLRDGLASIFLWSGVWFESGMPSFRRVLLYFLRNPPALESYDTRLFLMLGFASTVNSMCFVTSLKYVTPFNSALIHPSIPVFAVLMGSYLGVESLCRLKIYGAATCIIGSLTVVYSRSDFEISYSLAGNMLLILQSMSMAALLLGAKFIRGEFSVLMITAIYYSLGTALSIPLCSFLAVLDNTPLAVSTVETLLVVVFGAVFVVVLNFVALTWADRITSPTIPASSMMLQPPLTFILTYLWGFKQTLGFLDVLGGLAIAGGLLLTIYADELSGTAQYSDLNDKTEVPMSMFGFGSAQAHRKGSRWPRDMASENIMSITDEELDFMLNHTNNNKEATSIDNDETFQI